MLEVRQVSRSFGDRLVLDSVTFEVLPGRMTGFVGSNGAGKTTTMRIILGVLAADSGSIALDGVTLRPEDRRRFGYMPEERGLYPKMKVAEQLVYLARLHGLAPAAAQRNATDLLEQLGLGERAGDAVESLSLGNQQRAQIAAALVHDPEVLVLDEPFSGLDPIAVETVLAVLKSRAAAGAPVLFSSHQLDIVERLCDDLVVIADGAIRARGSREGLRAEHAGQRFELTVTGDAGWVRDIEGVSVVELSGGYAMFDVDSESASQAVLQRAVARDSVTAFARHQPSLAQIFREVIQ
ncbi:MAG: ATP-binding cassette domain-containing protein [Burkholderiaceae bacterium]|nr:ATP-binding cassette domain-containing protein [Microbacteriaceae bacterium]